MPKKVSKDVQLKTIRGLCLAWENGCKDKENTQKIMDEIYMFSHINGTCKNPHLNWHEECRKAHKELVIHGLAQE